MRLHGGGLSSSIVAQQCGDVSLVEGQIEILNGIPLPIGFGQAMEGHPYWHPSELAVLMRGEESVS